MEHLILAINPGSTSTKFGVYKNSVELFAENIQHSPEELNVYKQISDQQYYRKDLIVQRLNALSFEWNKLSAVIGRGGLVRPVASGIYQVNAKMRQDLRNALNGEHASNLGGLIAHQISKVIEGCEAYIADPVMVDEMWDVAKITGHPLFEKKSIFHALNQKAVARRYAEENGLSYQKLRLIVCHMGGGVTVGAHINGKVVDVNNGYDGNGPFSPERAGTLPAGDLIKLCLSLDYGKANLKQILTGGGGIMAHLGTSNFKEVLEKCDRRDDSKPSLVYKAFVYNVGKEIGALAAVLKGKVDAVILTGGIAHSDKVIADLKDMVGHLGPFVIYPGENELDALAENAYRGLVGDSPVLEY